MLADPALITLDLPEDAGLHVGGEQVGQPTLVPQLGSEVERRDHVAVEIDVAVQIGFPDAVLVQGSEGGNAGLVANENLEGGLTLTEEMRWAAGQLKLKRG